MSITQPGERHKHCCGFDPSGYCNQKGCGHVFEHVAPPNDCPDSQRYAMHLCPNCGSGPWVATLSARNQLLALLSQFE